MANKQDPNEKVVYVGDSRVRKRDRSQAIPPDYTAFPGKSEAFIPNFLLKEWMVGVVVLVGFLVLVMTEPAPLGYPADPLNAAFIPMPDWYFLFLYQLLKYHYASGDYVVLGVLGLSGLPFIAMLLAPFLDTGKERRFYKRPIASSLMIVSVAAMIYLTWYSWDHYQGVLEEEGLVPEHIERRLAAEDAVSKGLPRPIPGKENLPAMVAADDPAFTVLQEAQCLACHGDQLEGSAMAPALRGIGDHMSKDEIYDIIANGRGGMPAYAGQIPDEQIEQIAAWLELQKSGS